MSFSLYTQVSGLRTHARVYGDAADPPLVVVPGLGCASWLYRRLAWVLARERRVYAYDPPGHGLSQGKRGEPTTVASLSDHLAAWMTEAGLGTAPLFGHSLGGEVVIDMAARHAEKVSALIACAPTGIPDNPSVTEQLWHLLEDIPRERPELLLPAAAAYLRCGPARMWRMARAQSHYPTGHLLPLVHRPTLLLDGTADPVIRSWTVQAICRHIPDSVVREIEGAPTP
ncbi:alpha/beta fold hydrolase [Deinococcus lacus]|uniref:Alpha/beta fold hydrolase n=1 Tax=Deinococcus lacus TaxID=392561 RepID=A0ABW1YBX6_9DEIO